MKKRSILAILLAALLALTIFTGCAASTKSSRPSAPQPSAPTIPSLSATMEAPMEESVEAEEFAYDTVATTEAGGGSRRNARAGRLRCRLHREDHLYRLRLHRDDRV